DQKMSESSAPTAPTTSRIPPIVCSSMPLTVVLTAQIRIAPAATRIRVTPIPMFFGSFLLKNGREVASLQGKALEAPVWIRGMEELVERRAYLCRLTPDRALESLEDAHAFLRDRGMLTRTPDSALPSFFGACHEEPHAPSTPGFGTWPRTKYPWFFELATRADVHELKVHNGKSILFTNNTLALVDPICRKELERMEGDDDWATLLRHLADAGPSTPEDIQTELGLNPNNPTTLPHPLHPPA